MLENEYKFNKRFREYVDKYCRTYGYTVQEALKHEVVRQVLLSFTEV